MAIKSFLSEGGFSVGSVGSAPIEVIDSSGNITAVGLTVSGNLVVNGSTTTINSTTTTLDDPIITLGGDTVPTSDDNKDRGIEFRWHDGSVNLAKVGFFGFDDSTGKFVFIPNATNTSEVFSGTKGTIDANLEWADVLSKPSPVITVTLTGDVTGTANTTLTSLGNGTITINTTVNSDAVALGTDTTGAYVLAINNGSYLTGGNGPSGSESAVLTLGVDATSANTASKVVARDASGNFSAGAITATGMTVKGASTLTQLILDTTTSGSKEIVFYDAGVLKGYVWNSGSVIGMGGGSGNNSLFVNTTTGNTGVGTNTPGGRLEVNFTAATGATALILRTSDSGGNGAIRWQNSGGTNQAGIGSNFNVSDVGALEFLNGTTTNVIFRSSGNVGIGKTNPQQKLHIAGTNARIAISNDADNNWAEIGNDGASGQNTLEFFTGSSSVPAMSITHANNVGIGTTAPGSTLQLGNYTGNPELTFAAVNNGVSKINFYDNNSTEGVYIKSSGEAYGGQLIFGARWDDDEDKIVFKMYQVSGGASYHARVGIGTTSPTQGLHLNGGVLRISGGATGHGEINLDSGTEYDGWQVRKESSTMWGVKSVTSGNDLAIFVDNTTARGVYIKTGGNVGINQTNPQHKLDVGGAIRTTDWLYIENSNFGIYSNASTAYFSTSTNNWDISSGPGQTWSGLRLYSGGRGNTWRGHFYGDSTGQGFLDSGGNWQLIVDSSSRLRVYAGVYNMDSGIRVLNPGGAAYSTNTSIVTGAWKIKLPTDRFKSNTMMRMTIKIYRYSTGTSTEFNVGGYNYSDAAANWYNIFAEQQSDIYQAAYNIRFGNDGTANCIWIGETNSTWDYPQVFVTDFEGGYSGTTQTWASGWSITPVTAFDTVTQTRTAAVQVNSNNIGNYGVSSITGTANQVTASASTGAVTLSLPQNIHTSATPTFGGGTLNGTLTVVKSNGGNVNGSANAAIYLSQDESSIQGPGTNTVIRMGGNLVLGANSTWIAATNGTTAITINNSQNTTLAGNLTVSGTGGITSSSVSPLLKATSSALGAVPKLTLENTNLGAWNVYLSATDGGDFKVDQDSTNKFRIAFGTGNATLAGNLTVSGTAVLGNSNPDLGAYISYGTDVAGWGGIWFRKTTKSAQTMSIGSDTANTVVNAATGGSVFLRVANGTGLTVTNVGGSIDTTIAGNLTVNGTVTTLGTANGSNYILTPGTDTSTGVLALQAGQGSAGFGGGLAMFSGTHATYPGWTIAGLASGVSTAKFAVNNQGWVGAGTNVFTVDRSGNTVANGTLIVNSTTDATAAPTGSISASGGIAVGTNKKFMATGTGGYWGAPSVGNQETLLIRATGFGYNATSYAGVQIGGTAGRSIVFGVDVSAIAGGQFTGAANEWIIPNTLNIRQVTSAGTDFSSVIFSIGNGGAVTVAGNLTVSGTGTSSVGGAFNIGANCYVPNANFYRGKNAAGSSDYRLIGVTSGNVVSIDADAAGATFGGNITVSGTAAISGNLTVSPTWNSAGTNFTALNVSVTDTASGSASNLFKVSGASGNGMTVDKNGRTTITADLTINNQNGNVTGLVVAGGNATFAANVTVSGNLIVNGTTTTVNSTVSTIKDPVITLGGGDAGTAAASDDNKDRGIEFKWYTGSTAKTGFFGFDDSTGYFTFIPDATNSSEVFSGTPGDIEAGVYRGTGANLTGPITESSTTDQAITLNATDNSWKYLGFQWSGSRRMYFGLDSAGAPMWGSDINNTTFQISGSGSSLSIAGNTALHAGNYNSYAPTLTGTGASGTWGISVTGNAATATTLQTARNIAGVSFNGSADITLTGQNISTSSGTAANDIEVAKYLRWKNYGNNHILIDASAGTNPAGGAIDRYTAANTITNAGAGSNTWGEGISLMGWNGSATYGVRVDRARTIDNQANSATTTAATANTASTIVLRDASGNFSAGTITSSNLSTTTLTQGGTAGHITKEYTFNLSAQSNTQFFPIRLTGTPMGAGGIHTVEVVMDSFGGGDAYNHHSVIGKVRGSGWTDLPAFYDVFHNYYDNNERSYLGFYRGTQQCTDVILYVRGGKTYYVKTPSTASVSTTALTVNDSVFAIKDSAGADVSGTSANVSFMLNLITTTQGRHISSNLGISGSLSGSLANTLTLNTNSGAGLSGSATFNNSGAATFTVTSNATAANTASTIVFRDASGNFSAGTITAALSGNASTATTLQTARNFTINGTSRSFNGSADVSWSASDIGLTSYLPLAGGTLTGSTTINGGQGANNSNPYTSVARLIFNNDYNDSARGPNKIQLYDSNWLGGFGVHNNTLSYYSGANHSWYQATTASNATHLMTLNTTGLGIGTNSPSFILDVQGGNNSIIRTGAQAILQTVVGSQAMVSRNAYYNGNWYYANNGYVQAIRFNDDQGDGSIQFHTGASGSANAVISGWDSTGIKMVIRNGGNVGIGTTNPGYKLEVNGSFAATTKSFVIKHPTKEGKKLRYGSLEGPENGVYVRGKLKGTNVIELPDYWTKLVDPESITVQLTPIGSHQKLYVEKIENNKVYIANENLLSKAINCFFYVLAERCDVEKLEVEIDA